MSDEVRLPARRPAAAVPVAKSLRLKTHNLPAAAGGLTAVVSAARHATRHMGVLRAVRTLGRVNRKDGFDCPGCAWPDPEHRSMFEFCENGAKAVAEEATTKRIGVEFFRQYSVQELADHDDYWLGSRGRLCEPMILRAGSSHYEPLSWDEAMTEIADGLRACPTPNHAAFYTSGRTSNEAAFLYQLLVRKFGTNNLPDCSNLCHESSGRGLGEAIGIGKGTVRLEDFVRSDLIIVIGQNPGTNHPRMLTTLQAAKRAGARIISINPLREVGLVRFRHPQEARGVVGSGTILANDFVPVRVGGDVALLKGIMKAMLELDDGSRPGVNRDWMERQSVGFEAFADDLAQTTWESVVAGSGVSRERIEELGLVLLGAKSMIVCWAMGLTQHRNGVANVQSVANLLMLGGHFGRPGAGACPVRGHSNVQGDRTMGIWERPSAALLDSLAEEFAFSPPRSHGLDAVETLHAMNRGDVRVFVSLGGNFLSASPDTDYCAAGLRNCELTVQISTKLNRSHLVTGRTAIILPCLGRTERDEQQGVAQFVTVENSFGYVHCSRGRLAPASTSLRSEPWIVCRLASELLDDELDWMALAEDYDRIRDHIGRVIPGFENFCERMQHADGFYLPNVVQAGGFGTEDGKAHFTVHGIPEEDLQEDELIMMTIRSHDQYNTTIYGLDDRYRGVRGERRVVLMNAQDMAVRGLSEGDVVDLHCDFAGRRRSARSFAVLPFEIPPRCVATYFPEANVLVPVESTAAGSNTPASKFVPVRVEGVGRART